MGNMAKGITFGVTEQVTNTKLHTLVDSATISNIVNADISDDTIENVKIKTINTVNKVSSLSLSNLASLATTAGYIPSNSILPSLASGATIKYDGAIGFYGEII